MAKKTKPNRDVHLILSPKAATAVDDALSFAMSYDPTLDKDKKEKSILEGVRKEIETCRTVAR